MYGRSMRHIIGVCSRYEAYDLGIWSQYEPYDRCKVAV